MAELPGGTVTFLLTDVEGSTALWEEAPEAMRAALVRDGLPDGASLLDLGAHRLRDLTRPERVVQLSAADLPAAFPPLASLDARPNNLPIQTTSLVGRGVMPAIPGHGAGALAQFRCGRDAQQR
jgi:class 3 adenylate cyclase